MISQLIEQNKLDFLTLFDKKVKKNPDKIILKDKNKFLSYNDLNKKSDQVARYLRTLNIKANDLVGLCGLINIEFIICMLGIIKSGATYFPIDPFYPRARLEYMLKDAAPISILVEPQFKFLFQSQKIIEIEEIFSAKFNSERKYEEVIIPSESLAYVVYTSGSTGLPKGIMISHSSLSNVALAHNSYYPSQMRMLVTGGVCFDASLLVMFHALANGETLYLFNYNAGEKIDNLFKFIEKNSIEYLISVPSQYIKLLQKNKKLPFLKCVSLTGENLPRSLCDLHVKIAPNAILYNEYGPSECAIGTTIAKIYDPKEGTIHPITVGKPLPNTQVYILDQNLNRVLPGEKGEIFVSGIGLAVGYLKRQDLTDEKFLFLKIDGDITKRVYRTGDLGRFLPNGNLEFLGRVEYNIQFMENWINLGEIENVISNFSGVEACAVVVKSNDKQEKQVIIYFTTSDGKNLIQNLNLYIFENLPRNIPFSVVQVREFPLSPNGKIDKDALLSFENERQY